MSKTGPVDRKQLFIIAVVAFALGNLIAWILFR